VQAEHLDVVTDVADHGRRRSAGDADNASDETRTADSSGKDDDLQARLLSNCPMATCVRGPTRS
jgi:hypothetical protein